jgi:hypothetical protein
MSFLSVWSRPLLQTASWDGAIDRPLRDTPTVFDKKATAKPRIGGLAGIVGPTVRRCIDGPRQPAAIKE